MDKAGQASVAVPGGTPLRNNSSPQQSVEDEMTLSPQGLSVLEISSPGSSSSFLGFLDNLCPGGTTSDNSLCTFGCLDPF